MNLFQLVFKQMRQRALSTWMTLILVVLGVGLAISVMIVRRESQSLFGQSDFGYEAILGPPKASATQLVFNTVYLIDVSPGNIPYSLWQDMQHSAKYRPYVRWAIPFMVGDTYQGRPDRRIVGTSPEMFGYNDDGTLVPNNEESHPFEYRIGKTFELADSTDKDKNGNIIQPHMFAPRKFEAVLGSEVAAKDGFHLYDNNLTEDENYARHAVFQATHGMPLPTEKPDIHKPKWHVVGFLKQSHTAYDRGLFVPVISLYGIEEHEIGEISQKLLKAGFNPTSIPPDQAVKIFHDAGIETDGLDPGTRKHFHLPPKDAAAAPATQPAASAGGELVHDKPEAKPVADAPEEEDPDAYHLDKDGNIVPDLPEAAWEISAMLIKTRGSFAASRFLYDMKYANNDALAVNPAEVMREFFNTFFKPTTLVMLGISLLVTIVAAGSILVGIYNSVAARMREIAILRALGATRRRVLTLICVEAGLIGFFGGVLGLILGHLLAAVGSIITNAKLGETINWINIGWRINFDHLFDHLDELFTNEPLYLVVVVLIAVLAGLVPALKAYTTPVATNLSAG